ncbi:MAG: DUF302 domain-containing protein [Nanoarchaeota archaeon]|nr:DUF302 domain-containing protein [Nanoarchaeota archaeon]
MIESKIFSKETDKSVIEVAEIIRKKAEDFGFIVRYDTDMTKEFKDHRVDVRDEFEYHTIMLCIPEKAYNSVNMNNKRAAIIMPKQVSIFRDKNKTIVSTLVIGSEFLEKILPNDEKIRESLPASCMKVVKLIEEI